MPSTALMKRIARLAKISLDAGAHDAEQKQYCVMEAVAYVAGEPHSDHPKCTSPVITRMLISFNDRLKTNEDRDRLLKPLIPELIGTRTTDDDEQTRAYMALDWVARQKLPIWFRLCGLTAEAEVLEGLSRVVDAVTAGAARGALYTARDVAYARRTKNYEALRAQLRDATPPYAYAADADAAAYAAYAAAAYAAADAAPYAAAYAAADAAAYAADAAGPSSLHAQALRAATETIATGGDYYAARSAAREVYDKGLATDPAFAPLREETAKVQEGFVELARAMCAVGRGTPVLEEVAS